MRSKEAQARLHRHLARVAGEHLADQKTAHEHYEKALELAPEDVTTLHAFARLLGEAGKWARAVELREQRPRPPAGTRAAALLCEIGDIYEKRLSDDDSARRSYERALERDERRMPALTALATLHRRHKRLPELLDVLAPRAQAGAATAIASSSCTSRWRARPTRPTAAICKAALAAYREALRIDPANAAALSGLERLCRREGNWDVLAEALKRAPRSVAHRARAVRGARAPRALGRAGRGARGGAGAARRARRSRGRRAALADLYERR